MLEEDWNASNNPGGPERVRVRAVVTVDKAHLSPLPGMIRGENAVAQGAGKREAFGHMEKLGPGWLPVLNDKRPFPGIVERTRIIASLLLDVASKLEAQK